MTDFDKVRAILDAATPGPWETHTYGHRSVRQASGAVTKALFAVPVSADVRSLMTDLTWVQTDDYNIALTGNGPHQTENARAIVTAVNLAPELIAVAEAATVVLQTSWPVAGMSDLAAALDALHAKMKETLT